MAPGLAYSNRSRRFHSRLSNHDISVAMPCQAVAQEEIETEDAKSYRADGCKCPEPFYVLFHFIISTGSLPHPSLALSSSGNLAMLVAMRRALSCSSPLLSAGKPSHQAEAAGEEWESGGLWDRRKHDVE